MARCKLGVLGPTATAPDNPWTNLTAATTVGGGLGLGGSSVTPSRQRERRWGWVGRVGGVIGLMGAWGGRARSVDFMATATHYRGCGCGAGQWGVRAGRGRVDVGRASRGRVCRRRVDGGRARRGRVCRRKGGRERLRGKGGSRCRGRDRKGSDQKTE